MPTSSDWLIAVVLVLAGAGVLVASALVGRSHPTICVVLLACGAGAVGVGARLLSRHVVVRYGHVHVPTWLGLFILLLLLAILPLVAFFSGE
jgi:hypothetical protein